MFTGKKRRRLEAARKEAYEAAPNFEVETQRKVVVKFKRPRSARYPYHYSDQHEIEYEKLMTLTLDEAEEVGPQIMAAIEELKGGGS